MSAADANGASPLRNGHLASARDAFQKALDIDDELFETGNFSVIFTEIFDWVGHVRLLDSLARCHVALGDSAVAAELYFKRAESHYISHAPLQELLLLRAITQWSRTKSTGAAAGLSLSTCYDRLAALATADSRVVQACEYTADAARCRGEPTAASEKCNIGIEAGLFWQHQRCLEAHTELRRCLFEELMRDTGRILETSENRATELIVLLRGMLDQAWLKMLRARIFEPSGRLDAQAMFGYYGSEAALLNKFVEHKIIHRPVVDPSHLQMFKRAHPKDWTCKFLQSKDIIDVLKRLGGVGADGKPSESWNVKPAELGALLGGLKPSEMPYIGFMRSLLCGFAERNELITLRTMREHLPTHEELQLLNTEAAHPDGQACLDALMASGDLAEVITTDPNGAVRREYVIHGDIIHGLKLGTSSAIGCPFEPVLYRYSPWLWERLKSIVHASLEISLDKLEPDLYQLVLDEQPSKYHSVSNNCSAPSLFEKSWLDLTSDINLDAKHVRLTPQKATRSLAVEKGTFCAWRLDVLIEYRAPLVYNWSFAQHLPSHLESHKRLSLSRALRKSLRAAGHINNKDANPRQPQMQAYVAAVKSCKGPEQIKMLATAYQDCMKATCNADPELLTEDVASVDWHRVAAYMLRRALKVARVHLAADKDVPLYPLLHRAIEKVSLLVREMQGATYADPAKCEVIVCVPTKPIPVHGTSFGDVEAALAAARPADAAAWSVQKWADVWSILEQLQQWQNETDRLKAVAQLHMVVASELLTMWPWCSAQILSVTEQMLLDNFDCVELRLASLRSLAACHSRQQLWASADDKVEMALDLFERLHGHGNADAAPVAAARSELRELRERARSERRAATDGIDNDVVSQLEHSTDVVFAIKQNCMNLGILSNAADSTTLRRVELDCAAVIIKLRHVMEQSVRRVVQRKIIEPETQALYDRFAVFIHDCVDEAEWAALLATILADPAHPAFHATADRMALHFAHLGSDEWHFWGCRPVRPNGYEPSLDAAGVVSSSMVALKELSEVHVFLLRQGLAAVKTPDMHGILKALVFGALKYSGSGDRKAEASLFPFTANTELRLQEKLTDSSLGALSKAKDDAASSLHVRPPLAAPFAA
jgi:hypothetical protein